MGSKRGSDAQKTHHDCTQTWQVTQKVKTCELFYTSIRDLTPEQAAAKCATAPIKTQLQQLKAPLPAPTVAAPHI
jgi:hypothetical protein